MTPYYLCPLFILTEEEGEKEQQVQTGVLETGMLMGDVAMQTYPVWLPCFPMITGYRSGLAKLIPASHSGLGVQKTGKLEPPPWCRQESKAERQITRG